ncbi:hypothetical protein TNCV_2933081 [Trichonephila clavipes]|nr:hypothetical protein TNCV_2933081 [Trichonephila clavipes]
MLMVSIPFTARHRVARRKSTAEHQNWMQNDWSQVLYTDEPQFRLEKTLRQRIAARLKTIVTVQDLEIILCQKWNSIPRNLIDNSLYPCKTGVRQF